MMYCNKLKTFFLFTTFAILAITVPAWSTTPNMGWRKKRSVLASPILLAAGGGFMDKSLDDLSDDVKDMTDSVTDSVKDKAGSVKDTVKDEADSVKDKVKDKAGSVKSKAEDVKDSAKDKAKYSKDKLGDAANSVKDAAVGESD